MSWTKKLSDLMYGSNNDGYEGAEDEQYVEETYESTEEEQTTARPANQFGISSGSSIEMKVVKPEKLESVSQIADQLLARKTILLNLEETNKETSRRLIDFLNGVAYAISGTLKKVANNTYVITPSNVEVSGEQLHESQEKAADNI
ncbi:MAG: cell division protein SepF [Clostridia bacterium]|nr:cell division protein SepF [Clostridia bacterium]